ncbi:hypothetical protein Mapa_008035 [Marchantia paleacea]|nr:hypothetical protein Mapa_008035 [Marchantia paleacea]
MLTLVAAGQQQLALSASRASQSLLFGSSSCSPSSSAATVTLFSVTGLRITRVRERRNFGANFEYNGNSAFILGTIRGMASRKDRRDSANGEPGSFKPDISSLKSGLARRFPAEAKEFRYEWDSDDEEDGEVTVKSFAGRRSPKEIARTSAPNSSSGYNSHSGDRDGYQMRSSGERRSPGGLSYQNRNEGSGRWASRASRNDDDDNAESRSFSGGRADATARNREAYERRMNGGKPVPAAAAATGSSERGSNRFSSGRGQDFRIQGGADGRSDASGARNFSASGGAPSNSGMARSFRDERSGGGKSSGGAPEYDRTGRREWVEEVEKKKKPVVEPVNFQTPMNKNPNIAILGGGMSGLVCALTLQELGINSTVFDTGKHGLGGRMATRSVVQRGSKSLEFDHAAQFFTVTDPRFQKLVNRWISEGAVKEWKGSIGNLQAGGEYTELPAATRYVGTNGMRYLADHMVSQASRIEVRRPCWISRMTAQHGRWTLSDNNKPQGEFDAVVIAHNGKCANRLLAPAGVAQIARQMKRLELSSIWALLAAFEDPLPSATFEGAFVQGVNCLSWMGNNSAKLNGGEQSPQCWTFLSTGPYGKKNKVPQESIPHAKAEKVTRDMLLGVETALGLSEGSLPAPVYSRLQLWGAALPTNTPEIPCIFDAQGRVGICGDWLLGSSLEAAALSGMALAEHIANYRDQGDQNPEEFSVGLQKLYNSVDGHDIGQFPGTSDLPKESPKVLAAV